MIFFFFEDYNCDFVNLAEDATLYECEPALNEVMNKLEINTEKMLGWFSFSKLYADASKCHLFISIPVNIRGSITESSNFEKILGIYIDSNFSFEYHKNRICRKASRKFHALTKIAKYFSEYKKRMLFKSFPISQLNFCPVVWMCHGRGLNGSRTVPRGTFPKMTFPRRTVPQRHFPDGQFPDGRFREGQFTEG